MHRFSQLCGFGQKRWRLARSGPVAQLMIMRARRPRSQGTPELWFRYHAARSRARRTPANADVTDPGALRTINGGMGRSDEPISSKCPLDARSDHG